jgi:protoporphyrinogen oxidase
LGAGVAGLAASYGLRSAGIPSIVYESKSYWGGHTNTTERGGYWFDEGPHLSFTNDPVARRLFESGLDEPPLELTARIVAHYEGQWLSYPPQVHLFGLDPIVITECIRDFVRARESLSAPIKDYAEWLSATYGQSMAERFHLPYTRKYWTVDASLLGTDWIRERMHSPTLEDVLTGALTPAPIGDFHYLQSFRYPARGGFKAFLIGLAREAQIQLSKHVVTVDVRQKTVDFRDGSSQPYYRLVSTLPLPQLVKSIRGVEVPSHVHEAASKLLWTSVALVEVELENSPDVDFHWAYFYDEALSFSRVTLPHLLSSALVPAGAASLQAEVYFSRHKPPDHSAKQLKRRVIDELFAVGLLKSSSRIRRVSTRVVPYANIVYDHYRAGALAIVKDFIRECDITLAGRYGEWEYYWTDQALQSGLRASAAIAGMPVEDVIGLRTA